MKTFLSWDILFTDREDAATGNAAAGFSRAPTPPPDDPYALFTSHSQDLTPPKAYPWEETSTRKQLTSGKCNRWVYSDSSVSPSLIDKLC
jgi:hypothetical protein